MEACKCLVVYNITCVVFINCVTTHVRNFWSKMFFQYIKPTFLPVFVIGKPLPEYALVMVLIFCNEINKTRYSLFYRGLIHHINSSNEENAKQSQQSSKSFDLLAAAGARSQLDKFSCFFGWNKHLNKGTCQLIFFNNSSLRTFVT